VFRLTLVAASLACLAATTSCFGPSSEGGPDAASFDSGAIEAAFGDAGQDSSAEAAADVAVDAAPTSFDSGAIEAAFGDAGQDSSAEAAADVAVDAAPTSFDSGGMDATFGVDAQEASPEAAADVAVDAAPTPFDSGGTDATSGDDAQDAPSDAAADVAVDDAAEASVEAAPIAEALSVTVSGKGTVTDGSGRIACSAAVWTACEASLAAGTPETLTATPAAGQTFVGWDGDCSGTGTCVLTMDMPHAVTARFVVTQVPLDVTLAGTGSGTVVGGPIDCGGGGASCSANLDVGTMVTLTATAAGNTNVFAGWTGACSGKQPTCTVTLTEAKNVTATFAANTLTVQVTGYGGLTGGGLTVGRNQTQVTAPQPLGTPITVTAQFVPNWFVAWGADCSSLNVTSACFSGPGVFTCTLTLDGPKTAAGQFFDDGPGTPSDMNPNCSAFNASNTGACWGADGTSPYDLDGDGFIGCDEPCGAYTDRCGAASSGGGMPCDCNDCDALVYPGNGCSTLSAPSNPSTTCSATLRLNCDCGSSSCP
jgi:hypothetical protein